MWEKIIHFLGKISLMSEVSEAILLAGGHGKRLQPFSFFTSKHLLPVDDVPMIFYPLKNLQLIGIKKVFLIVNEEHIDQWNCLLCKFDFEMSIQIVVQDKPLGIPAAIQCCSKLILGKSFLVALGDNVIIASNFLNEFRKHMKIDSTATICGFKVSNPQAFGVAEFNANGALTRVVEKPDNPPSEYAIAGFYQFPRSAFEIIKNLNYSDRGELEVADLINNFIDKGSCAFIESKNASDYWIDTGTNEALVRATNFIRDLKKNSGVLLANFENL